MIYYYDYIVNQFFFKSVETYIILIIYMNKYNIILYIIMIFINKCLINRYVVPSNNNNIYNIQDSWLKAVEIQKKRN